VVPAFEEAFAKYVGAEYAVAVSNGTAALHLSVLALKVNPGDKVITTPITFAASANCVRYCEGEVVFADIDPNTALIDLDQIERLLGNDPGAYKGIIPVDFAGLPVNMERIKQLADQYGLWIIEDACHAPGGYFIDSNGNRQYCGSGAFADLAIFSFHPVKHIASGEGGMITTNRRDLYERLLMLRTHGITKDPQKLKENHGGWYYEMQDLGYNYRLTDFQAALGCSQLERADDGLARRIEIAKQYDKAFEHTKVDISIGRFREGHAYHLYVIKVEDRKGLYEYLRSHNIIAQVHYIPVHMMPYYRSIGKEDAALPQSEKYYEHCLSLPMYPTLTNEDQEYVITKVLEYL
jgi:UDP-4-amino-4,6-dideoxy-N-acetyl-beta-L-altrosamine transaminase